MTAAATPTATDPTLISAPPPTTRRGVRLVIILGSLSAFGPLSIDMYLPGLPDLADDLGTSASQVQLTLSACLLGLAAGQLVAGPISDAMGRRRPLLVGLAAYAIVSLLCAAAPTIVALIALRFAQGFAGAAGIVIARAVVRDLHTGLAAARFFSLLMLVNGLAPILAPVVGGQLLHVTTWRGIFVVLAVIGVVLLLAAALGLGESLPAERRQTGGIRTVIATFGRLLADRVFVGRALALGFGSGGMFAYIAGSPFVLQEIYGASPQSFSLMFGANALGLVFASQLNGRLIGRAPLPRLLLAGLIGTTTGGLALLTVVLSSVREDPVGEIGLIGILPSLFLVVASLGFVFPNATALALQAHPQAAGSASALLGLVQFATGATVAPLVGLAGEDTALPMALVIAACGMSALAAFLLLGRRAGEVD